jgi:hypothetical protein
MNAIPTDPNSAVSTLSTLYHSGAYACLAIVAVYLALKVASTKIAWLAATPTRVHDVAIALGILAIFVPSAAAGSLPSIATIATSIPVIIALVLPGRPASQDPALPIAKVAKIGAVLALALMVSCATLTTMTGAWATCAKTDLGQIVDGQGKSLSGYVADLLDGNGAALESALLALAGQVGLDAVECAVTAYEQTHAGSGGSAMATSLAASSGLARAQAWIAAQRKAGK